MTGTADRKMLTEILDVNYIVGALILAIFGLIRWVIVRLNNERRPSLCE